MNLSVIRYLQGWILKFEALFLSFALLCALIYKENTVSAFAFTIALSLILGCLFTYKKPKRKDFRMKEGFVAVALSWILLSIIGAIPFVITGAIPSFVDALFETISGFTTTGATILNDVEALPKSLLFWRSFTHWIGGMGVLVFVLAILPMDESGSSIYLMRAESPGPTVGKLVPRIKQTAKILYLIYLGLTLLEFIFLLIGGLPLFDSITMALGTAGTGGFGIYNDSAASFAPHIQVILTVFMILFGVNFNAFYFILLKRFKDAFSMEEVKYYFIIIFVAIALITINIVGSVGSVLEALLQSSFQVGSIITTTGFSTVDFNTWPATSRTILMLLMFVGACAGSTGGGFKVSRVILLLKSGIREIKRFIHPRGVKVVKMDGKTVTNDSLASVNSYLAIYLFLMLFSIFLVSFDDFSAITNISSVVATINNIGPGLDIVGPMGNFAPFSNFSKFVFMFDMLAGRLEIIPMLLLFSPHVWKK